MRTATSLLIATVLIIGLSSNAVASRELTFEERVRVQEAIESVYYRHQMGTSRSFEEAVPRAALEYKVRTYLK